MQMKLSGFKKIPTKNCYDSIANSLKNAKTPNGEIHESNTNAFEDCGSNRFSVRPKKCNLLSKNFKMLDLSTKKVISKSFHTKDEERLSFKNNQLGFAKLKSKFNAEATGESNQKSNLTKVKLIKFKRNASIREDSETLRENQPGLSNKKDIKLDLNNCFYRQNSIKQSQKEGDNNQILKIPKEKEPWKFKKSGSVYNQSNLKSDILQLFAFDKNESKLTKNESSSFSVCLGKSLSFYSKLHMNNLQKKNEEKSTNVRAKIQNIMQNYSKSNAYKNLAVTSESSKPLSGVSLKIKNVLSSTSSNTLTDNSMLNNKKDNIYSKLAKRSPNSKSKPLKTFVFSKAKNQVYDAKKLVSATDESIKDKLDNDGNGNSSQVVILEENSEGENNANNSVQKKRETFGVNERKHPFLLDLKSKGKRDQSTSSSRSNITRILGNKFGLNQFNASFKNNKEFKKIIKAKPNLKSPTNKNGMPQITHKMNSLKAEDPLVFKKKSQSVDISTKFFDERQFEKSLMNVGVSTPETFQSFHEKAQQIAKEFGKNKNNYETSFYFYCIDKMIDKGAYGKVFLARSVFINKPVAIKCFEIESSDPQKSIVHVKQEIKIMNGNRHKNVIKLLDFYRTKNYFFVVTELAPNGNLLNYIQKHGTFDEFEFLPILKQIVSGIYYLHKKNILHRDIKLENMLIGEDFQIKICDFGISKFIQKGVVIHEHIGTPAYIAPEVILEKGYNDFKSDIWSLGVLCYIALTGEIPFDGNSIDELRQNILNQELSFPKDVYISEKTKNLITAMLEKSPAKRYDIKQVSNLIGIKEQNFAEIPIKTEPEKLQKIEECGFTQKVVSECLANETTNHIKALFELV